MSVQAMRTIYDEYNDEEVVLSKDELRMIMAIRKGQFPHVEVNPYEPYVDWWVEMWAVLFPLWPAPSERIGCKASSNSWAHDLEGRVCRGQRLSLATPK
eukprot:scaffold295407_cov18-Tisochrysis_lutea.AAC.1